LTEYLGIKGINLNLNQILFGMDTMDLGDKSSVEAPKPKLYNAMDVDPESDTEPKPDKGKGVDRELHPNYDRNRGVNTGIFGGGGQGTTNDNSNKGAPTTVTPLGTGSRVIPG
jgi:hypothetical protein